MIKNYKIKSILLIIKEIYNKYSDSNIIDIIYSIIKEYDIHFKFNYFINDNIINNNIFIEYLNQFLQNDNYEEFELVK